MRIQVDSIVLMQEMIACPAPSEVSPERILIFAPTRSDAAVAQEILCRAQFVPEVNTSIDMVCQGIRVGAGAVLIAQEALTPPALELLAETLAQQAPWSDLPLIVLTRASHLPELAQQQFGDLDILASATFLERPLKIATLIRAVKAALNARRRQYQIRDYIREREQINEQRFIELRNQRAFVRGVLGSVTEGKLIFCNEEWELPPCNPTQGEQIPLTRSSLKELRERVKDAALDLGFASERILDLITGASEAGMNAVVHAGGGAAWVCKTADDGIQVWIKDEGSGISMERLPHATLERGFSSAGTLGHGFWLTLNGCDHVYLLTGAAGTTVVLEQGREAPPPALHQWWRSSFDLLRK